MTGATGNNSLWMFDYISDAQTYRIYSVDNSVSSKRLDVCASGTKPCLYPIGSTPPGQVWDMTLDGAYWQLHNQAWKSVLDVTATANQPYINNGTHGGGAQRLLRDNTPNVTSTIWSTKVQYTTITPAPTVVYVGGATVVTTFWTTLTTVSNRWFFPLV